jgi:hypothetical protein
VTPQEQIPRRFGAHASVIQLLALFITGTSLDGGATLNSCALASLLFWTCAISLLSWDGGRTSHVKLFFLRWGLLAFVLIGTPLFRPVVQEWEWLAVVLLPAEAILLVGSLLYLTTRIFGLRSPFDELGLDSTLNDKRPPQV